MTDRPDNTVDEALRDAYRSIGEETAPRRLDETVLGQARAEVEKDEWLKWFLPWLRPAAFAATVGLSLAVLLEVMEQPPVVPPSPVTSDFATAAEDASTRIRTIGEDAAARVQAGDPGTALYTAPDTDAERYCDEEQSATPESWRRCIEDLRDSGRHDQADAELRLFRQAHPELE